MATLTEPVYKFLITSGYSNHYLVENGYICFSIVAFYVIFSKSLGPSLMANRKPFKLKNTLIVYNFLLSATNLYLAIIMGTRMIKYWNVKCRFRDSAEFPNFLQENGMYIWHCYLVKFVELLDTVFFVLRKKNNQITFLHVFHHTMVCGLFFWILQTREVGFYLLVILSINCFVHVIMYLYYGLAAIGPHMQKYLWWKKHLTTIQIIQFCIFQLYLGIGLARGCEYTEPIELVLFFTITALLLLFCNFYRKTFKKD